MRTDSRGKSVILNSEWMLTFSTGAAGLAEKPRRSFTDTLEGFCTKEEKIRNVYTHLLQIWTSVREKALPRYHHIPERLRWSLGRAPSLKREGVRGGL